MVAAYGHHVDGLFMILHLAKTLWAMNIRHIVVIHFEEGDLFSRLLNHLQASINCYQLNNPTSEFNNIVVLRLYA